MVSIRDKLLRGVVPPLAYAYIRFLRVTMKIEYRNREALGRVRREAGQYVLTFWHSRFLMMPYCYPDRRLVVLLSRHRDAQMLSNVVRRFGLATAFGSSTVGGVQGLRDVLRRVKDGHDVGIAPDGPRGPRRRAKAGAVAAARISGLPMIPVTFSARPARRMSSWDRTLVPRPFSRGLFIYGEPIRIDGYAIC